jgi:hypothetical protein
MEVPELTSTSGVFTYYLALILAVAFVIAVYLVAVSLGLAPPPSEVLT